MKNSEQTTCNKAKKSVLIFKISQTGLFTVHLQYSYENRFLISTFSLPKPVSFQYIYSLYKPVSLQLIYSLHKPVSLQYIYSLSKPVSFKYHRFIAVIISEK